MKEINTIKKFEKIFIVWKLLYNIQNYPIEDITNRYMGYQNNDFEININNSIFDATKNTYIITIFFNSSEILKEMKKDKDFYFIQFHDNKKETFNFSYSNLDNSKLLFKDKDNKMTITLSGTEVTLEINEEKITSKKYGNKR